jgi:hypothetical protein
MLGRVLSWVFGVWVLVVLIDLLAPQLLSTNLKDYDSQRYEIALRVSNNPSFTKGDVSFYVSFGPGALFFEAFTIPALYPNSVFLSPDVLYDDFFDIVIDHELGHLEYGHGIFYGSEKSQTEADIFAVKIVGKERLRSLRLAQGFPRDHYLIRNLED